MSMRGFPLVSGRTRVSSTEQRANPPHSVLGMYHAYLPCNIRENKHKSNCPKYAIWKIIAAIYHYMTFQGMEYDPVLRHESTENTIGLHKRSRKSQKKHHTENPIVNPLKILKITTYSTLREYVNPMANRRYSMGCFLYFFKDHKCFPLQSVRKIFHDMVWNLIPFLDVVHKTSLG